MRHPLITMKFFFNNKARRFKSAETIVEVIIAIFVVALGSASATTLVVDALRSNGLSRDNLIAMNLAVEGVEAVRNIRDSNWLKFNYDRAHCWNMKPGETACIPGALIPGNNFIPYFNPTNMAWYLDTGSLPLDLNAPSAMSQYMLVVADADKDVNSDGVGSGDDDLDLYTTVSGLTSQMKKVADSKFYRMVTIDYPTPDPVADQGMTVTSIVQWKDGNVHQIKIMTKLTNYMKVKVK